MAILDVTVRERTVTTATPTVTNWQIPQKCAGENLRRSGQTYLASYVWFSRSVLSRRRRPR